MKENTFVFESDPPWYTTSIVMLLLDPFERLQSNYSIDICKIYVPMSIEIFTIYYEEIEILNTLYLKNYCNVSQKCYI